ncbi:MAG: flagellar hook-associated protein FlgK [Pseudomonadota bacterium]|jgi:flagellar hook-associated protein 1 FlgK
MGSLLSIGVTAVNAAQYGLLTTQHNIANANTLGYSRQNTVQSTNIPMTTGSGAMGQGVHVDTVKRSYDAVLNAQYNQAQTLGADYEAYYNQVSQIDNILADASSGLTPTLQDFFKSLQQVAANPSLTSARQSMVSSSQALATRFQTLEGRLADLYDNVNTQVVGTVSDINAYASQLAQLNEKIASIRGVAGDNIPPNDLLDQRDQLVSDLSKLVRANVTVDRTGSYNVFIGSGQQLVVGNQSFALVAQASAADPERMVVALKGNSRNSELPDDILSSGGKLGGLLRFRSESLDAAANGLGQVAASVALTINAQHALGQNLLGQTAENSTAFVADYFQISAPKVIGNSANSNTADFDIGFVSAPPPYDSSNGNFYTNIGTSDYQLERKASGYVLTRLSDGYSWPSSATLAGVFGTVTNAQGQTVAQSEGLALSSFTTDAAVGDTFLIQPTREIARNFTLNSQISEDVRRIAAGTPFRTGPVAANTGSATISPGTVSTGYSTAGLPLQLIYAVATTSFSGFPVGATVNVTRNGTAQAPVTITALTDPVSFQSGDIISFNGLSFQISGSPVNGDRFKIEANSGGISDARNMVALGALQTRNTTGSGAATYQVSYAQIVGEIGSRANQAKVSSTAQAAMVEQTQKARDSVSGVNMDEEAANLIRYQQAYQAAAKMLEVGSQLFGDILAIAGN